MDLDVYSGPFDVLLSMITARRLDLTEVSLSSITEEFLDYVRGLDLSAASGPSGPSAPSGMDEASAFIDVASVLIEAKSASLLPSDEDGVRDESSMEALRERDLLFARLLQYRAYKEASREFRERMARAGGRYPHPGVVEEGVRAMMPELVWTVSPDDLAKLAARAIANAPVEEVSVRQLHVPPADLREQSRIVMERLLALGEGETTTFDELVSDASRRVEVAARFLALLAFFKQGVVQFRQDGPYEPLHLRWMAGASPEQASLVIDEGDFA
ncbi:segregation and condensation protein A [Bifidobacterium santillanense]